MSFGSLSVTTGRVGNDSCQFGRHQILISESFHMVAFCFRFLLRLFLASFFFPRTVTFDHRQLPQIHFQARQSLYRVNPKLVPLYLIWRRWRELPTGPWWRRQGPVDWKAARYMMRCGKKRRCTPACIFPLRWAYVCLGFVISTFISCYHNYIVEDDGKLEGNHIVSSQYIQLSLYMSTKKS